MNVLLDPLNNEQREIATSFHGPILVLAGAGSGKTKALTHRMANMIQENVATPQEILAVTFTNKAAKEMKERLKKLVGSPDKTPTAIGTFHSLGVKILRETANFHNRPSGFTILDTKDSERIVKEAMQKTGISIKQISLKTARSRISFAKNSLRTPQDLSISDSPIDQDISRIFAQYERLLLQHQAYDFDDLLLVPLTIFEQHPDIRGVYQKRWRFLSVDEYQDTNAPQEKLLRLLLGPEKNICVVGDDYQAIYSWRGANVDHILQFEATYPACKVIYLTQNYRSTAPILEAANQVIAVNKHQKHKQLWTKASGGLPISLTRLQSETHEANYIREQIMAHKEAGGKLNDCVLLYRTNAQSRVFEEEFLTHRIPYTIVGGFRFYERREIKDALAFLTLLVNPSSIIAFRRLAESYLQGVGPKTIQTMSDEATAQAVPIVNLLQAHAVKKQGLVLLAQTLEEGAELLSKQPTVADLLSHMLNKSGYMKHLKTEVDSEERLENIEELLNVTALYTNLELFLEEVALLSDIDSLNTGNDKVTCMSIHAAKGLEFPLVFMVGLEEGLLPHINSLSDHAALEEERRLMYVGMTRAKQRLVITHAVSRAMRGETTMQIPSRFLQDLPKETLTETSATDSLPSFLNYLAQEPTLETIEDDMSVATFSVNDFVRHPVFGKGVVIALQGKFMTCIFESFGVQSTAKQEVQKIHSSTSY